MLFGQERNHQKEEHLLWKQVLGRDRHNDWKDWWTWRDSNPRPPACKDWVHEKSTTYSNCDVLRSLTTTFDHRKELEVEASHFVARAQGCW